MSTIKKLQSKLEQKYTTILNIPKDKINFNFFIAINEYIRIIEKNNYIKQLLYNSNTFNYSNPYNLLIERGRSVSDLNQVFKTKKVSNIFIAYFNLYAIYIGIEDINNNISKTSLTENRLKRTKHLKNIRDREKIVGTGYFWFNKKKYHEWTRIVHRYIIDLIEHNEKEEIKDIKLKSNKKKSDISYRYDLDNQLIWFVFNNKEVEFKGKRAMVFHFFYMLNKINDKEYKTYHDFNRYLLDKPINTKIDSISFRQNIDNINKRIKNEINDIKNIIELKEKNNPKEINRYKWKIKI